jgi:hypothetical protein
LPAAGYSGRIDPCRVALSDEDGFAARTTRLSPGRGDDQVSAALSAMYVPRWRIGSSFHRHSAGRAAYISEFAQKIKMERARERRFSFDEYKACVITRIDHCDQSIKLLARRSKAELNCRTGT